MSSSEMEILEAFAPLIKMGVVGFDMGINGASGAKFCKVKYEKLVSFDEAFASNEIFNLPPSKNMQEALKAGYKTGEKIIAYCKKIHDEKQREAIASEKAVLSDEIGLLSCQDPDEECSWDRVYEMITPDGDIMYERTHCY